MGRLVIRKGTEADIPWMIDKCRITHGYGGIGEFCPDRVAETARATEALIAGDSLLGRVEIPISTTSTPTLNHVLMWHTTGHAWELLSAHERASSLPSSITVMAGHPRQQGLVKALQRRGYQPFEIHMVKHGRN